MKAIIDNGTTYKVISERGVFTYTEDNRGKVKVFETANIEVVEISEMPKVKTYTHNWSKGCDSKMKATHDNKVHTALCEELGRYDLTTDELMKIR